MKTLIFIALITLSACGGESSPEGRMNIKVEGLHNQIDSLKKQNAVIIDSLSSISSRLNKIQSK